MGQIISIQFALAAISIVCASASAEAPLQYPISKPKAYGDRLEAHLSPTASVYYPDNPAFGSLSSRYSDFSLGSYAIIAEPATIDDVATCVSLLVCL